jgi:effector-binding domain-containing protein
MLEHPSITETPHQHTAVIPFTIPRREMSTVFGPAVQELLATLSAQNLAPAGPLFAHHFTITPDTFDFEIGFPIASPITPSGRVQPSERPAMKIAHTLLQGDYQQLPDAWSHFMGWVNDQQLPHAPDIWECYVAGPESSPDPASWRTQLIIPLNG